MTSLKDFIICQMWRDAVRLELQAMDLMKCGYTIGELVILDDKRQPIGERRLQVVPKSAVSLGMKGSAHDS